MAENLFIWDLEDGDKPNRKEYRAWVLAFFTNEKAIRKYMYDLLCDIQLCADDEFFYSHNEGYKRQIEFFNRKIIQL